MSGAIELGALVEDTVTGFQGIAVARLERLHESTKYNVESRSLVEGRCVLEWFDVGRLVVIVDAPPPATPDL